ncbi:receptor expression-enhancing protein 1 isoform X2 [Tachysurus vachellii]|uniref:receptor expression-enhancing protein 1 isoform X2 n=1 Tax=Tachysurus vachellii TaxID=175792 RepID=UPI00296B2885|nr:receptor expression-enhancing protein 1 isoform X2 [Tachysurus vachellii]
MVSWIISRLVVLIFGTLYPAYSSYKAVKSKDVREYVKWMMYWIIFALFTTAEVITDLFLCWLPFYYELKIAFMVWLLSPYTKGSSVLYRKFVHPTLSSKEKDIDEYLCQAKDKSYDTLMHFGKKSLNVAATAAVMAATKGQGVLSDRLRSFSMHDLTTIDSDGQVNSASVTTQPASGQHRARSMMRSKSEAAYSKSPEFDITEFEMLNVEQFDSLEPSSPLTLKPTPMPRSISNPSQPLSPPEPSQDKTEAPEVPKDSEKEGCVPANSAQLRLLKRRAPEPPPRALRPVTRSRSKNTLSANPEAM